MKNLSLFLRSLFLGSLFIISGALFAQQNSMGVNTVAPNTNAVLHLVSPGNNQGLLIPVLTTAQRTGMSLTAGDNGLLVFDGDLDQFFYWQNPSWVALIGLTTVNVDGTTVTGDGNVTPLAVNVGTGANQIVQLGAAGQLPAVDGGALTNVTAATAANFSGALVGDITGTQGATVISAGSVTGGVGGKIADGSITAADIAAATITDTQINNVAAGKVTGLGTAATINVGTGPSQIVQLDGASLLPAVDGSALTNVTSANFSGALAGDVSGTQGATVVDNVGGSTAANINTATTTVIGAASLDLDDTDDVTTADLGTGPNQVVQLDGASLLPAVDGSALTNVTSANFSGALAGDVSGTQGATVVDNVGGSTAANINTATTTVIGAASLDLDDTDDVTTADLGTGPNQVVQLDGASLLPAVDGSALTNVTSANFSGALAGDVSGTQGATVVDNVGGSTAANINTATTTVIGAASLDLDDTDDVTTADLGTGPNQVVQLDGASLLPAVDGSALTNVTSANFSGALAGDVSGTQGATVVDNVGGSTAANINTATTTVIGAASLDLDDTDDVTTADLGTGPNQVVQLDGASLLPAVDGSALTNVTSANFSGALAGDVSGTQGATVVDNVGGSTAANINTATTTVIGAASLDLDDTDDVTTADLGTGPNQVVQLDGASLLPAVDGSALTNVTSANFSGALAGDVSGTQGATVVDNVGGSTAANINTATTTVIGAASLDLDDTDDVTTADLGTGPNQVVQLDGASLLPAVDGSALTNVTSANFSGALAGDVSGTQGATVVDNVGGSTAANINTATTTVIGAASLDLDDTDDVTTADLGTGPNQVVQLDGASLLPAVDGSALTNVTSANFSGALAGDVTGTQGATVIADGSVDGGVAGKIVDNSITAADIAATTITDAEINDVAAGKVTGLGTAATINVGTAANEIVQLDGGALLPAVDGSALTNVTATGFSGALAGDVTGTQGATVVSSVNPSAITPGGATAAGEILEYDGIGNWVVGAQSTLTNADGVTILGDGDGVPLNVGAVDPSLITPGGATAAGEILEYDGIGNWVVGAQSTLTNADGVTILGDGDGVPLNVGAVDPSLITPGGATAAGEILEYDGIGNWVVGAQSTLTNADGVTILGDGDGVPLNVGAVDPSLITPGGATAAGEILEYDGIGNWVVGAQSTLTNADGVTILGDGDGVPLNVGAVDPSLITPGGATAAGEILEYDGIGNWVVGAQSTLTNADGVTILGDGDGVPLNVGAVDPSLITPGGATVAGEILEYDGIGNWIVATPTTPLNSGNGVTINGTDIDLEGTLTANAAITTGAAASDLIINGAGTLDVDAIADFSAPVNFNGTSLDVSDGTTSNINSDNINLGNAGGDLITINGDLSFEKGANDLLLSVSTQTNGGATLLVPDLPSVSETIALLSDVTPSPWTGGPDISYGAGRVGIGTATPVTDLHIYNTVDQPKVLTVDAQGATSGQSAGVVLTTLGDGINDINNAATNGWLMLGYGNTFGDPTRQNDLGFSSFNGVTEISNILHLDATGTVGIGTDDPRTPLQIGDNLGLAHFQNATATVDGEVLSNNLYPDYTNAVDNDLRRLNGDPSSFIFLQDGEISFHTTPAGAANSIVDLMNDVDGWLDLRADGSVDVTGFDSPGPGVPGSDVNLIPGEGNTTGNGGTLTLRSGGNPSGDAGNISLEPGTASGIDGIIDMRGITRFGQLGGAGIIELVDDDASDIIGITVPAMAGSGYNITLPAVQGAGALTNDGGGILSWAPGGLSLPYAQSQLEDGAGLFFLENTGLNQAGRFDVSNISSTSTALSAETNGTAGSRAFSATQTGDGNAGEFQIINASSTETALIANTNGLGTAGFFQIGNTGSTNSALSAETDGASGSVAVNATNTGAGQAGRFQIINAGSPETTLLANTDGIGSAGFFEITNGGNSNPALRAVTIGSGPTASFDNTGSGPALELIGDLEFLDGADRNIIIQTNISGPGNTLFIDAGSSGTGAADAGGDVDIAAGDGGAAGNGGNVILSAGIGNGGGNGGAIALVPGTGAIEGNVLSGGNFIIQGDGSVSRTLFIENFNGSAGAGFKAADAGANTVVWELPDGDGSSTEVLTTDGLGTLYWSAPGGGLSLPYASGPLSNAGSLFTLDNDVAPAATFINSFDNTAIEVQGNLAFIEGNNRDISIFQNPAGPGDNLSITAGSAGGGGAANGGALGLQAGNGISGGNGGDIFLNPGAGATGGNVVVNGNARFGNPDGSIPGALELENDGGANAIRIEAAGASTAYTIVLPPGQGSGSLTNNGSGLLSWAATASFTLPFSGTDGLTGAGSASFDVDNTGTGAAARFTSSSGPALELEGDVDMFSGANRSIIVANNTIAPGNDLDISAGNTTNAGSNGGTLNLRSGDGSGAGNGGNIRLEPGVGTQNGAIDMRGITRFGQVGAFPGAIELENNGGANAVEIRADGATGSYSMTLPPAQGGGGETLINDGAGILSWGSGDFFVDTNSNYQSTSSTLASLTSGNENVLIGTSAGSSIDSGLDNVVLGRLAANTITSGSNNVIIGRVAGNAILSGTDNIILGNGAGTGISTSIDNVAIGRGANSTSGDENIAIGRQALSNGGSSVAIGRLSNANLDGIALGNQAIASSSGSIALGQATSVGTGSSNSVAIGNGAIVNAAVINSVALGTGVTATTSNTILLGNGTQNVGIGTPTPSTLLDVNGDVSSSSVNVAANINLTGNLITTPDGPFSADPVSSDARIVFLDGGPIAEIAAGVDGQEIIVISANALIDIVDVDNGGNNIQLANNDPTFQMNVNATLHLVFYSGFWIEIGRSAQP